MIRDFNKVYDRHNTSCFKWDKNKEIYGKDDIISMWVADMDLPVAPEIEQCIIDRALHPLYGYTFRDDSYFDAFINWQKSHNSWQIKPDWLINSTSVVISLNMIIRSLTQSDDKILIFSPAYSQFAITVEDTGRQLVKSSLINNEGYFRIDFADLESKLASGIKLLIFCSPHNPVGRVWKKDELLMLSGLCLKYHTLIVSDEIHSDLIYQGHRHIPLASLSPEISAATITCMSPGKTFNISGLSISFIITENEAYRTMIQNTFDSHHLMSANIFGIEACQAAYLSGNEWLIETRSYLQENRDYLFHFIQEYLPMVKVFSPEGTFLAWLDFREYKLSQKELQRFLVHVAGLGLDNGTKFGPEGEGFMRLNFACSCLLLIKALQQLYEATQKLFQVDFDLLKLIKNYKEIEDCD